LIVVDTNILIHSLVESSRTEIVRQLWAEEPAWRAPGLWRWEFTNVLWLKVKTGGMQKEEALGLTAVASRRFIPLERSVSMKDALQAALEFSASGYDGAFLALARKLKTRLVTEDQKLRKASPTLACSIEEFLSGNGSAN